MGSRRHLRRNFREFQVGFRGFRGSQVRYMGSEGVLGDFRTQKAAEVFRKHYRRAFGGFSDDVHGVRGCLRGILMAFQESLKYFWRASEAFSWVSESFKCVTWDPRRFREFHKGFDVGDSEALRRCFRGFEGSQARYMESEGILGGFWKHFRKFQTIFKDPFPKILETP